jgi:condensin complex subunit 2
MEGQQVRKTRPENVHFAKKAKRVDVKRLKDDIWSGLKTLVPDPETDGSSEEVSLGPCGKQTGMVS